MIELHHYPLCPYSRFIRVILFEKGINFSGIHTNYWERDISLMKLNPAGEVPIIIDGTNVIADIYTIFEFLEETYKEVPLLSDDSIINAEIRRLISWFHHKFYNEVTKYILNEKVIRYYLEKGYPNTEILRAAKLNLDQHLKYIQALLKRNSWLAGNYITAADYAAATHLSTLDYLGNIDWNQHLIIKEWYAIIKSRPSFRSLLKDRIHGFNPPESYSNLDF